MAALAEQLGRVGLLEITEADLARWDVAGDGKHRHMVALAIEQTIDEMEIAWPATSRADGELARRRRIGACRKRACLFVANMHEDNAAVLAELPVDRVEAVAGHPPYPFDAGIRQRPYQHFSDCDCHSCLSVLSRSLTSISFIITILILHIFGQNFMHQDTK